MNHRWLFRMARWAQNPPSESKVKFVFAIILGCIALFGVEYIWGLPDWMAVEPRGIRYRPQ